MEENIKEIEKQHKNNNTRTYYNKIKDYNKMYKSKLISMKNSIKNDDGVLSQHLERIYKKVTSISGNRGNGERWK